MTGLEALARPSGTFAMVAMDQRESLRTMLRAHGHDSGDERVRSFKTAVARELAPHASGFLIDRDHLDAVAQPGGERWAFPRCRDGDRDASLAMNCGCDEAAVVQIVYSVHQDALSLGLGPDSGVGRAIVGPRDREPGTREIARPIEAAPEVDPARCRELCQAWRGLGTHHGDVRAR